MTDQAGTADANNNTVMNAFLSKKGQAREIVQNLTISEKISLLSGLDQWHMKPVPQQQHSKNHAPPIALSDGPHGLRKQTNADTINLLQDRVTATCFPTSSCLACSWDVNLLQHVGAALANECRAHGVGMLLAPGLNLKRHACGGRNFEYYSEDPLLSGILAAAFVNGVQQQILQTTQPQEQPQEQHSSFAAATAACVKHFCVNNQEHHRMSINVVVDERTMRELYLRGFEICIKRSSHHRSSSPPLAVMAAYNRVNGVYCSDHVELLQRILREEWKFEGIVVTDWGATNDRVQAIKAGVDLEMPSSHGAYDDMVREALESGALSEQEVDCCVERNVALSLLGNEWLTTTTTTGTQPAGVTIVEDLLAEHHVLAREAAMQSAVLLKNTNDLLPLARETAVAVFGDLAQEPRYQGMGSSQVKASQVDCPLDRFHKYTSSIQFYPGYEGNQALSCSTRQGSHTEEETVVEVVAVVFVGLPDAYESEGVDRAHMHLPREHNALVEAVCDTHARVVVVLMHGGPVTLPWVRRPQSILTGYLAGQAGGSALTDLIFGVASPCGKLAETFPICQEDQVCDVHFPGEYNVVEYREGLNVGYRGFDAANREVLFPFGHGLSYSRFEYSQLNANVMAHDDHDDENRVEATLQVCNVGSVRAAEVVQCYVHDCESSVYRPIQELKAFAKVWLDPGEQTSVKFELGKDAFSFYDIGVKDWVVESGTFEIRMASSSRDVRLSITVEIVSRQEPSARARDAHPSDLSWTASDEEFCRMMEVSQLPAPTLEIWPFHSNSLLKDLHCSWLGGWFAQYVRWLVKRGLPAELTEDPDQESVIHEVVNSLPLRGLVIYSRGILTFVELEILMAFLNHSFLRCMQLIPLSLKKRSKRSLLWLKDEASSMLRNWYFVKTKQGK